MKLTSVDVANFKAINHSTVNLHPAFNVLVGANGSGKSSVLQAIHWLVQSGRNSEVKPEVDGRASTLSEKDAIYMPSPDYKRAGHGTEYGNFKNNPQLDMTMRAIDDEGIAVSAVMSLKAARNEGISVHVPTGNPIVSAIRDREREFSAYIPGLAGIPLFEEKRSKQVVHRSAAAGDANTVLRNMLDLLRRETVGGQNGLDVVSKLVARVMGEFELKVDFDDEVHTRVLASFRTSAADRGENGYRPLELAGVGYLQVLQIFCYLIYFRPRLLLVDEPDAHLYPVAQERLVEVLSEVAAQHDSQVVLTTHSPTIVRALPQEAKVIWMKDGDVEQVEEDLARQMMGWGLLDKKILLLTEDEDTRMLRALIGQWKDLERVTAVWPFYGSDKVPSADALEGFRDLVGDHLKIIMHHDGDFLMPTEKEKYKKPYRDRNVEVWFTKHSDVEAYWAAPQAIASHFRIRLEQASDLLREAADAVWTEGRGLEKVRKKRNDVVLKLNRHGDLPNYSDDQVEEEATADGEHYRVLGKDLIKKIRTIGAQQDLPRSNEFGHQVSLRATGTLAPDLEAVLRGLLI